MTVKVLAEVNKIFEQFNMSKRIIRYAAFRIKDIDEQTKQLKLEKELMETIISRFETDVCPDCRGDGHIMKPIEGCECDGPRMHSCETCNRTGLINHE